MRCRTKKKKERIKTAQWTLTALFLILLVNMVFFPDRKLTFEVPTTHTWSKDGKYICLTREEYVRLLKNSDASSYYKNAYEEVKASQILTVTATAYNATVKQCGKADGITASGSKVRQGRTIAVSRDLKHLMGHRVELRDGSRHLGFFIVEDLMAERIRGKKIDVYLDKEPDAEWFGRRNLKMVILGRA